MTEHKLVIFDTETNGFRGSSVLSVSILIIEARLDDRLNLIEFKKQQQVDRYYFPVEFEYDEGAFNAHKLDEARIRELRDKDPIKYPEYYLQDREIADIFKTQDALFIAHNISYDRDLVRIPLKKTFCTMLTNAPVLKMPGPYKNTFKHPKLEETARFYRLIKHNQEGEFHESSYDTYLCSLIVWKMLKNKNHDLLTALGFTEEQIFKSTSEEIWIQNIDQ